MKKVNFLFVELPDDVREIAQSVSAEMGITVSEFLAMGVRSMVIDRDDSELVDFLKTSNFLSAGNVTE